MYHPGIVPTTWNTKPTSPPFDWNHFIFKSCVNNVEWSEIKILTLEQKLKQVINEKAVDLAFIKYPNWGYMDNKRADNYVRKNERIMLAAGTIPVSESITIRPDGLLEIVVNADTDDEIQNKALSLLEQYNFDGDQSFGSNVFLTLAQPEPIEDY